MTSPYQTESDVIQAWLAPYTPHTQRTYQTDLHRFQKTVQKPLQAVTAVDLQQFQNTLRHLHVRSQVRIMATLSSLFKFAYQEEFLAKDPARGLPAQKLPPLAAPVVLTEDQLAQLEAVASSPRNRVLFHLMWETGLTVGEVCQLRWNHLHLHQTSGPMLILDSPEGPRRELPLSTSLTGLLKTLKEKPPHTEWVFTSSRSSPLHSSQVFRIIQELGQKANLPHTLSPSCLRHTYAHRALANGLSILDLQDRLGHSTLPPTLRYLLLPPPGQEKPSPPTRRTERI